VIAVTSRPPAENPYAGQGSVLLDIGGDIGALVVNAPAGMLGTEVEIRPASGHHSHHDHSHHDHSHHHLPHVAVLNRPVGGALVPSLVYPEVVEGRYELCVKGTHHALLTVDITGGSVTTADLPT
jgi:hypothetical protein